mgnify:CR=1 FL=1
MESKKNKLSQEIFATESIWRLMAKMCVPAVLTILIMVLYNMAGYLLYRADGRQL